MVFKSIEELKDYILFHIQSAILKSQEQIYQIIDRFIKEYYAEFTPEMDERTYQLYKSLVKSDIIVTNNECKAHVYFDIDALDYAMKTIGGKLVSNTNKGWSEEEIFLTAAHGSHGGYVKGTAIWDTPLNIINTEAYNILKRMLISEGIPLK